MRLSRTGILGLLTAFLLCAASSAVAQTPRNTPKPLATPPRVVSGAEIISRADELFNLPATQPSPSPSDDREPVAQSENPDVRELLERIRKLEADRNVSTLKKPDTDEVHKRMLLNLDILTRAEQRSESLRKQLFDMIEKENTVRSRLEQIEFDMRPEMIERSLQLAGSMRPEEIRENRRKSLAAERGNLQLLLSEIESTRASVLASLERSEVLVEKLRIKLEKDIDDALVATDN